MLAGLAYQHAAAGTQAGDAEGGEEQVQQAGVIGVAHVLEVELPIVRQRLGEAADDLQPAVAEHATHAADDLGAEPGFKFRSVRGQRAEHHAAERGDAQLARAVFGHVEVGRHAAFAIHTAGERDRAQVAAQIVAPGVIDALEVLPAAGIVQADQRAAMRAAVLEGRELAVLGARHHHGHAADKGGAVVADVGKFGLEA